MNNRNLLDYLRIIKSISYYILIKIIYFNIINCKFVRIIYKFPEVRGKNGKVYFGKNARIYGKIKIVFDDYESQGKLVIKDNFITEGDVTISPRGGTIKINNNVFLGKNVFVQSFKDTDITIGNNVLIATNSCIISSNHIYQSIELPISEQGEVGKGIEIEDDVWIGANVTILDGIKIGKGTVIGAGSIVTKSIPPYSISVGVPAKVVGQRK